MTQCALCTDREAVKTYEGTGTVAAILVQETDLSHSLVDIRIPLCDSCHGELTAALEKYRTGPTPDDMEASRLWLERLVTRLNVLIINEASGPRE